MAWTRRQLLQTGGLLWLGGQILGQPLPLLAAPAQRRLALLVGINQFQSDSIPPLYGAVQDVQQLAALLVEGFQFAPNDILILTQEQATRHGIESAILDHLGQASAEDVVFLHISSHGRHWQPAGRDRAELSLVVHDSRAATATELNDLSLQTLQLLLQSLTTTRGWVSLDAGFGPPDRPSDRFFMRGLPTATAEQLSPEAKLVQEQLRRRVSQRNRSVSTGWPLPVLLAHGQAASPEIPSRSGPRGLLTQYLLEQVWLGPTTDHASISQRLSNAIALERGQVIERLGSWKGHTELSRSTAGAAQVRDRNAEMVQTVSFEARLQSPEAIGSQLRSPQGALLTVVDQRDRQISLRSPRSDLSLETGMILQEAVRHLSASPAIVLGCSPEIERIERVDLASALSTLPTVTTASALDSACQGILLHSDRDGYRLVDAQRRDQLQCTGKTLKDLGHALKQQLPLWQARQRLSQLHNDGPESFPLRWSWRSGDRKKQLAQRQTTSVPLPNPGSDAAIVPVTTTTQSWSLRSYSDRTAELLLLLEDRQGRWWVWGWPAAVASSEEAEAEAKTMPVLPAITLGAGQEMTLTSELAIPGVASGVVWVIASAAPLLQCRQVMTKLQSTATGLFQPLENPSQLLEALVADLQVASPNEGVSTSGDLLLPLSLWATLAIAWQQS
ncbi:caspase family protein [Synechococcus elongatus]|uniref:caspase family protein n=1 Tax=Synechococcus elongatus TaxID=32046 RepID=UPI0030D05A30